MDTLIAIPNAKAPTADMLCGGQPTDSQLNLAKEQGFKLVINLRPDAEMMACGFDEAAHVKRLGMQYVVIPVGGPGDLTAEKAKQLHEAIEAAGGPVMVHCASGNRVGALLAIARKQHHGASAEQALTFGKSAGLTALEPLVRSML